MTRDLSKSPSIAILLASYNRRQETVFCLEQVFSQTTDEPRAIKVFLVDDGSSDGTASAVAAQFPEVNLISGDGNLFWNRGMRIAFERALTVGFDFYMWLNDDAVLFPDAVDRMLAAAHAFELSGRPAIAAGSTCDRHTGRRSYGGFRVVRKGLLRQLVPVDPPTDTSEPCDTMNGNCVLIPHQIATTLGNLEGRFHHSFGDLDYGFRARAAGFTIQMIPGFVAHCSDNNITGTWRDTTLPLKKRWRHLTSPKGSPFAEWSLYCRRHLGPLWPLYAISPYVKTFLGIG